MTTNSLRYYIDRLDEISRRGFLKGVGSAAVTGVPGFSKASSTTIRRIQSQYDAQFGDGDKIIQVVPRKAGGMWAITAWRKYLLVIERNNNILLMRVPKDAVTPDLEKSDQQHTPPEIPQIIITHTDYEKRLINAMSPNINYFGKVEGIETTEVEIRTAPNGMIISRRLKKSSGNREYDEAVLKTIDRTGTLPRDTNGKVPDIISLSFTPNSKLQETSPEAITKVNELFQ